MSGHRDHHTIANLKLPPGTRILFSGGSWCADGDPVRIDIWSSYASSDCIIVYVLVEDRGYMLCENYASVIYWSIRHDSGVGSGYGFALSRANPQIVMFSVHSCLLYGYTQTQSQVSGILTDLAILCMDIQQHSSGWPRDADSYHGTPAALHLFVPFMCFCDDPLRILASPQFLSAKRQEGRLHNHDPKIRYLHLHCRGNTWWARRVFEKVSSKMSFVNRD